MKITPFSSATELLGRLRAGEVSSRALLESYLQRIERHNPGLNAVVTLDAAQARSRADAADAPADPSATESLENTYWKLVRLRVQAHSPFTIYHYPFTRIIRVYLWLMFLIFMRALSTTPRKP